MLTGTLVPSPRKLTEGSLTFKFLGLTYVTINYNISIFPIDQEKLLYIVFVNSVHHQESVAI